MPKKKYIVTLTDEERTVLEELVNKGKNPAGQWFLGVADLSNDA